MNVTYGICELQMPSNYVPMDAEEMEYLDGGLYFNNSQVKNIVVAIGASTAGSVGAIAASVKVSAVLLAAKFSALGGVLGFTIGGALSAWVIKQSWTIAERFFSAIVKNKGVDFGISWKWGIIPNIKGTLR